MSMLCPKRCGGRDRSKGFSGICSIKSAGTKSAPSPGTFVLMALLLGNASAHSPLSLTNKNFEMAIKIDVAGREASFFAIEGGSDRRIEEVVAENQEGGEQLNLFATTADQIHNDEMAKHEDRGTNEEGQHEHEHNHYDDGHESETVTIEENKPYGIVLAATLLVNLATLSGLVLLVIPAVRKGLLRKAAGDSKGHGKLIDIIIPSFASGALMATAVFLVLPEALHLIEGVHEDGGHHDEHSEHGHRLAKAEADSEGATFAKWGCGILGGFLLPAFLCLFFPHGTKELDDEESAAASDEEECKSCMERDAINEGTAVPTSVMVREDPDSVYDADDVDAAIPTGIATEDNALEELVTTQNDSAEAVDIKTRTFIDYRLVASVIIGDFFCNFADGLFIGAAFLGCSWATAVSITLIALLHEIPQELADFVILTRYAGCTMVHACALNFTTGIAVCFGGLIVLAVKPSDETVGIILAIAGGVYLNLAASESMPRVANYTSQKKEKAWALLSFAIGTVPLGLILLDHKHC